MLRNGPSYALLVLPKKDHDILAPGFLPYAIRASVYLILQDKARQQKKNIRLLYFTNGYFLMRIEYYYLFNKESISERMIESDKLSDRLFSSNNEG